MIHHLWLTVNPSGNIVMRASQTPLGDRYNDYIEIFNASSPLAAQLYRDFRSGKTIYKKDIENVRKQNQDRHIRARRWKIVDMNIAPNDRGTSVLNITFELDGMKVSTSVWPPRSPSGRRYLEAFQVGNILYDEDYRDLKNFARMEANNIGLNPQEAGIMDWNPDWNEYL